MIAAPKHGFVYLATPKTGSTAIEEALTPHAQVILKGPPKLKHTRPARFERQLAPFLASSGFPRDSYQTVATIRNPIDWLASWWRYRSRSSLANRRPENYTGHLDFAEFATQVMQGEIRVGQQARFLQGGVDFVFPYENIDALVSWLSDKVGTAIAPERRNVSPEKTVRVDAALEAELAEFYAEDVELWRAATQGDLTAASQR